MTRTDRQSDQQEPVWYGVVPEHSPTVFLQVPAAAGVSCASLLAAPSMRVEIRVERKFLDQTPRKSLQTQDIMTANFPIKAKGQLGIVGRDGGRRGCGRGLGQPDFRGKKDENRASRPFLEKRASINRDASGDRRNRTTLGN